MTRPHNPPNNLPDTFPTHPRQGRYNEAICDYNAVIELDANNTHAFHNRGISYDKLGMFEEAIKDFSKVLDLDPTNVNAYFNRGSAYDSIGNYELAVADYAKALDLDASQQSTPRGTTPSGRATPSAGATPRNRSHSGGGGESVSHSRAGSFSMVPGAAGGPGGVSGLGQSTMRI